MLGVASSGTCQEPEESGKVQPNHYLPQIAKISFTPANLLTATDPNRDTEIKPTTDFTQFAEEWSPRFCYMMGRAGLMNQDWDDCLQEILIRFYQNGLLNDYDPRRAVRFSTYVRGHARFMIAKFRARLARQNGREVQSTLMDDSRMGTGDDDESSPSFARLEGGSVEPVDEAGLEALREIELSDALQFTIALLEELPKTKTQDYARLFRDMVEMAVKEGEVSPRALALKYGISRQAVVSHMKTLAGTAALNGLYEEIVGSRAS